MSRDPAAMCGLRRVAAAAAAAANGSKAAPGGKDPDGG
jgi:hypothetical protein